MKNLIGYSLFALGVKYALFLVKNLIGGNNPIITMKVEFKLPVASNKEIKESIAPKLCSFVSVDSIKGNYPIIFKKSSSEITGTPNS